MINKGKTEYIRFFKPTPRNKDAEYYYKPGKVDIVLVNPRFQHDPDLVDRLISYLQADVEGKKRFSKGMMELRESCRVEDLEPVAEAGSPAWEPPGLDGSVLPGGEIAYLGRPTYNAARRLKRFDGAS
jgi:hypothetical protein